MAVSDVKTVRVFKNFGGSGTKGEFSNTYHILSPGSVKDASLVAKVNVIVNAERAITSDRVFFKRAVVSTYASKEAVGGPDRPYIHKINAYGSRNMGAGDGESVDRYLPPEACLVMDFGGGIGRGGGHLYRYAIGPDDWRNLGGAVELLNPIMTNANAAWAPVFNDINGNPPIVFITEDEDGLPTEVITTATCGGYRLRQLTQKKGKKKGAVNFDVQTDDEDDAAAEMAQVVEVLQNIEAQRYTEKGAAFFTSPKFLAMLSAIAATLSLVKSSKDNNDYGPLALNP